MTNKEAYIWILDHFAPCDDGTKQDEALGAALEALEKQIPKKPNKEAIDFLRRLQEPEAWEPQINEAAFNALEMAISALEIQTNAEEVTSPLLTEKWKSKHRRTES